MNEKEVKLPTGKTVKLREGHALDEIMASEMLDKDAGLQSFSTFDKLFKIQVALTITEVDGQKVPRPNNFREVIDVLGKFVKRDWTVVTNTYNELNGLGDEKETKDFLQKLNDSQTTGLSANG